jgi:hypothetical protein
LAARDLAAHVREQPQGRSFGADARLSSHRHGQVIEVAAAVDHQQHEALGVPAHRPPRAVLQGAGQSPPHRLAVQRPQRLQHNGQTSPGGHEARLLDDFDLEREQPLAYGHGGTSSVMV